MKPKYSTDLSSLASSSYRWNAMTGRNRIAAVAQPQISDKHVYDSTLSLIKTKPHEMQMKQKISIFSV